jgi:hypothetical protein
MERRPLGDHEAAASKSWGAHHLVWVTSLMVACKFCSDEAGPALLQWGAAGGFHAGVLKQAEVEFLRMLEYRMNEA